MCEIDYFNRRLIWCRLLKIDNPDNGLFYRIFFTSNKIDKFFQVGIFSDVIFYMTVKLFLKKGCIK